MEAPQDFYAWGSPFAYPKNASRYCEILDTVQGMTTPSNMHMLNYAVRCLERDEVYLEVGTWRGSTFIGAMDGNTAHGYAIDNDTMTSHNNDERPSIEVWHENVSHFEMAKRSHYITGTVPDVWETLSKKLSGPVGAYLFDGDKTTADDAYMGLRGVVPFLAKRAVILVDDANTVQIRLAVQQFLADNFPMMCKLIDLPTPGNCWPAFWNGLMIIGWFDPK